MKTNIFSGVTITKRHNILYDSIGYLPEEQQAYEKVWRIAAISLFYVIIGTILEAVFFVLYNAKFHPFAKILDKESTNGIANFVQMDDL